MENNRISNSAKLLIIIHRESIEKAIRSHLNGKEGYGCIKDYNAGWITDIVPIKCPFDKISEGKCQDIVGQELDSCVKKFQKILKQIDSELNE